jgi:REP element-mobilizing transposase RayT
MVRKDVKNFLAGEVYHVFNRGAHKSDVFRSDADYKRLQALLHVGNGANVPSMRDLLRRTHGDLFDLYSIDMPRDYVDVLAYCFMKNHTHYILRPKTDEGVERFMHKIMTGYSMYYNKRYDHSGTIWEGPFKARYVDTDAYLWQLFAYVHVNPVEYIAKFWKVDKTLDTDAALAYLSGYAYSSYVDFYAPVRSEGRILTKQEKFTKWSKQFPKPKNVLEYYLQQDFSTF